MSSYAEDAAPVAAAFFDLDKTIIARSSTLAFGPSFYRYGLIGRMDVIRTGVAQLVFRLHGADHSRMEKIRAQVSQVCRGWQAERVAEIVARHVADLILPQVYAEAWELLTTHRGAGRDVVIVSTSGEEMVGPIGELLGAAAVIATQMRVSDGRYTGEFDFYAYGEAKAARIKALAAERGYSLPHSYAYSDSITDLPMLEVVGHPRVVNPDRALRRIAECRGWPVLAFTRPSRTEPAGRSDPVRSFPVGGSSTGEIAGSAARERDAARSQPDVNG